jgi:hypothetical protein
LHMGRNYAAISRKSPTESVGVEAAARTGARPGEGLTPSQPPSWPQSIDRRPNHLGNPIRRHEMAAQRRRRGRKGTRRGMTIRLEVFRLKRRQGPRGCVARALVRQNLKGDPLTFIPAAHPGALDGEDINENVWTAVIRVNEPISSSKAEPSYGSGLHGLSFGDTPVFLSRCDPSPSVRLYRLRPRPSYASNSR